MRDFLVLNERKSVRDAGSEVAANVISNHVTMMSPKCRFLVCRENKQLHLSTDSFGMRKSIEAAARCM